MRSIGDGEKGVEDRAGEGAVGRGKGRGGGGGL